MSDFKTIRSNEDDILSSQSSDEKMDTGSESFKSQDTPNSILSSEFDENEQNVLRLQNPDCNALRLQDQDNDIIKSTITKFKEKCDDSLISKMSNLKLESPDNNKAKKLGISPPKVHSTLILTTNHPLMGVTSPDGYPDLIPKRLQTEEKDSLSSVEDERIQGLYSPQKNTSKNNLYFSENFLNSDNCSVATNAPDVISQKRRKIIPRFLETSISESPQGPKTLLNGDEEVSRNAESGDGKFYHSTPKCDISSEEEFHSGISEWRESPPRLQTSAHFELPIEMKINVTHHEDMGSPDVISSSTQEDKSAYQALLDPYTGSVALRPRQQRSPMDTRRRIQLPPEEDRSSLDSVSVCSMDSEEEVPQVADVPPSAASDEDNKRTASTVSSCSDPIPEYSWCEERRDERWWVSVGDGGLCDMRVIEPYKRVLSHGGYERSGAALIVFSACHLPDSARPDYRYVMDNLFLYVIWTLERLVTEEYVLIYLHGSAARRKMPSIRWLHECYKLIDRRLRKSLKHLYLVHPTFWLKSFVVVTKPFVSAKFFRKISYVRSLNELMEKVPVEPNAIPDLVKQYDDNRR